MALVCAVSSGRAQTPTPPSVRTVVVLGDLHMGVGRGASGAWDPFEDFRWGADLAAFLEALDAEGKGTVDLVLNGDTFELWESRAKDCTNPDPALGCSEAEARARLERVLAAHRAEVDALAAFARSGSNRIVIVPGDHDAALLLPSVGRRALDAFAAPGRVEIASAGHWASPDGRIWVEHGHQIGFGANRYSNWPSPLVRRGGRERLERTRGERLVQPLYAAHEDRYPIVDNVAEEGSGLKLVLAAEGTQDSGPAAADLLRYFLLKMSWLQFRMNLDDGNPAPPRWDLDQIRREGAAFLVQSLPADDRFAPLAARALAEGRLGSAAGLSDEEIVAVCDYRAAVRRARRRLERVLTQLPGNGPSIAECPRTPDTRGSEFEYYWRSRDEIYGRRLDEAQKTLRGGGPIAVFVHGHSHLADRGFSPQRDADVPLVINAGAWQRTITPVQLEERIARQADALRSLQPEQLPACYPFVQIRTLGDRPEASLRSWRHADSGGNLGGGCTP